MKKQTTLINSQTLIAMNDSMHQAGQVANEAAARVAFDDHIVRKATNTIRRKMADLALFEQFLNSAGVPASALFDNPQAWRGVTWGLVEASKYGSCEPAMLLGASMEDSLRFAHMRRSPPKRGRSRLKKAS